MIKLINIILDDNAPLHRIPPVHTWRNQGKKPSTSSWKSKPSKDRRYIPPHKRVKKDPNRSHDHEIRELSVKKTLKPENTPGKTEARPHSRAKTSWLKVWYRIQITYKLKACNSAFSRTIRLYKAVFAPTKAQKLQLMLREGSLRRLEPNFLVQYPPDLPGDFLSKGENTPPPKGGVQIPNSRNTFEFFRKPNSVRTKAITMAYRGLSPKNWLSIARFLHDYVHLTPYEYIPSLGLDWEH
jgi:hypothetical protein